MHMSKINVSNKKMNFYIEKIIIIIVKKKSWGWWGFKTKLNYSFKNFERSLLFKDENFKSVIVFKNLTVNFFFHLLKGPFKIFKLKYNWFETFHPPQIPTSLHFSSLK